MAYHKLLSPQVIQEYKDFAFADYARVGRALVLYEIGDRDESIAEMEDVSISLKGYPGNNISYVYKLFILGIKIDSEFYCRGARSSCRGTVCRQARSTAGREPVHHRHASRPSLYGSLIRQKYETLAAKLG